jgi:transcription elongation factor Elf1
MLFIESDGSMPLAKRPTKKSFAKSNKCPRCGSRKFEKTVELSLIEKIRFIGCTTWICGKCGKKWGG